MNVSFESKGKFKNATNWLNDISNRDSKKLVTNIAKEGTMNLSDSTPRATGETASSWKEKITVTGDTTEVAWVNDAHPEAGVNIAKLIEVGHGTRTGGYVPARPYIKDAMKPLWSKLDKVIKKELIK